MFAELRIRSGTGYATSTIIPRFSELTFDNMYLDVGAISFAVPKVDADALGLKDQTVIEVLPNGETHDNLWYAIEGTSTSKVVEGAIWVTFAGKSIANWLTDSVVYPSSYPAKPVKNADGTTTQQIQGHAFQDATPGNIIQTLIARAALRGTSPYTGLSWLDASSFTGATTTQGHAWAVTFTTHYDNGTTVLQVLQDLAARQIIDFTFTGMSLKVDNYGDQVVHYTVDQRGFFKGKHITDETANTDSSNGATVVFMQGEESAFVESTNSPTLNAIYGRRREKYVSQAGITDEPTLLTLANAELSISGHVQVEETLGVTDQYFVPWRDYEPGDWVWVDVDGTFQNLQVRQITAGQQDGTIYSIGLTLGDMISAADEKLKLKIDNMTGGDSGTYGPVPSKKINTPPAPPTSVAVTSSVYRDSNGHDATKAVFTWVPPTLNADGTKLTDLDRYEIQYQLDGSTIWSPTTNVPASITVKTATITGLQVGLQFIGQVRAVDKDGNASTWVSTNNIATLPKYTASPVKASTPVVSPTIKGLAVTWNGLDSAGSSYDTSFSRVEVHLSTTSGFTPSSATRVTDFTSLGGTVNLPNLSSASTYYVKLVTVDKSENTAIPSTQSSSASPALVASADVSFTMTDIGGVTTYVQGTTPTGANAGSIWIDTANGNVIKRFDGTTWSTYQLGNGGISDVSGSKIAAGTLPSTAVNFTARSISGVTTFTQGTTPTGAITNDLWIDTANANTIKTYNGTSWVTLQMGTAAIAANAITATQIAANTITASQIAAGTITATQIATGAITATKLLVTLGGGNLLSNSYNGITTGYVLNAGGSFATDATRGYYTGNSLKYTTSASASPGIRTAIMTNLLPNTNYTVSGWFYNPSVGGTPSVSATVSGTGWLTRNIGTSTVTDAWTRVTGTFSTGASPTAVYAVFYYNGTTTAGLTFNVDAVQVEIGDIPTAYAPRTEEILPGTIIANMISAGAITTSSMTAGTINGDRISTNTLSATSIIAGTLTAGMIATGTLGADIVLGASIKTASSGARVELSSLGVTGYNSTEDQTITISSQDGTVTISGALTGNISQSTIGESNIVNSNIRGTDILLDDTGGQVFGYIPTNQTTTTFSTAGTTTWTCPAGVFSVKVEAWGGGGGGGGGASLGTFGGFGGAGGEYSREDFVPVTPGTVYNVVVGAAGVGGAAVTDSGIASGGTSQFVGDSSFTVIAHGGGRAIGAYTIGGGNGSTNEIHFNGGGTNPNAQHLSTTGQGGASSAGTSSAGKSNRSNAGSNGLGGQAVTGGGSGGNGGNVAQVGQPGGFPGGAGGGGGGTAGGFAGGNGARGQVKITYGGLAVTFTAATDLVTFPSAHNYTVGAPISFTGISGGAPLVNGTTYYVNTVPSTTTLTLATLPPSQSGVLIDITTNGTGRASTIPTLVLSISGVTGTDGYGNAFPVGLRVNPFGGGGWDSSWNVVGSSGKPAYTNGYIAYTASGYGVGARYYKDALGFVHLDGIVDCTTSTGAGVAKPVFTLPAGYRPAYNQYMAVGSSSAASGQDNLRVTTTGLVFRDTAGTTGSLSLCGVKFLAEN